MLTFESVSASEWSGFAFFKVCGPFSAALFCLLFVENRKEKSGCAFFGVRHFPPLCFACCALKTERKKAACLLECGAFPPLCFACCALKTERKKAAEKRRTPKKAKLSGTDKAPRPLRFTIASRSQAFRRRFGLAHADDLRTLRKRELASTSCAGSVPICSRISTARTSQLLGRKRAVEFLQDRLNSPANFQGRFPFQHLV